MNRGVFWALLGIAYFFDFHEGLALTSHDFTHTNTHKSTFETHQNHGEISTDTQTHRAPILLGKTAMMNRAELYYNNYNNYE